MTVPTMTAEKFDASRYEDLYRVRVRKAVEEKTAGLPVSAAAATAPTTQIIDLLEALKRSVAVAANSHEAEAAEPPPPSAKPGPKKATAKTSGREKKKSAG